MRHSSTSPPGPPAMGPSDAPQRPASSGVAPPVGVPTASRGTGPIGPPGSAPVPAPAAPGTLPADRMPPTISNRAVAPMTFESTQTAEDPVLASVLRRPNWLMAAPPWLVSLTLHMVLLLALALWMLPGLAENRLKLTLSYSEDLGDQLELDTLRLDLDAPPAEDPVLTPDDLPEVDDPLLKPAPLLSGPEGLTAVSDLATPEVGLALTGRTPGMKKVLLAAYGGNAQTEAAVAAGLKWLARQQANDGTWSLIGPYGDGGHAENHTSATAMALLAYLGAGHTGTAGPYQKTVTRGARALLQMQKRDGDFWRAGVQHHRLYSQAQATIAVCELYGMTNDSQYRLAAQRAVDYAVKYQDRTGGWRYKPGFQSDTSVTGWFVMGLQSARMAGLEVPQEALQNVERYLDQAGRQQGAVYGYQPGMAPTVSMTAEALLCRQYLGWPRTEPRLLRGVQYISAAPIDWSVRDSYSWYYITQVLHHMGGDDWRQWNETMRQVLPSEQTESGPEAGSWSPMGDRWGPHGGRLYVTCMHLYMLEVYYRHMPIYRSPAP